ncbi:MAG: hypothetical protein LBJ86_05195 [Spirochaetaceae bacterium]|jgi:predicted nucleic acid-binding protein|nr:hypothetical protein [Spirochaetaceae bacterium]
MPGNYYDKRVIVDTSCLIALSNARHLGILKDLCKTVYITPEIAAEFGEPLPPWIQAVPVQNTATLQAIHTALDLGEASAITLYAVIAFYAGMNIISEPRSRYTLYPCSAIYFFMLLFL